MSNVDKMCLRLLAVSFLPLVISVPLSLGTFSLFNAFARMGTPNLFIDLPWLITLGGAAGCVGIFAVQAARIWRWKEGKGPSCPTCGCLLGGVRDGRHGPYRQCLGCRTNHNERWQ
jgi:hypothetical protein